MKNLLICVLLSSALYSMDKKKEQDIPFNCQKTFGIDLTKMTEAQTTEYIRINHSNLPATTANKALIVALQTRVHEINRNIR